MPHSIPPPATARIGRKLGGLKPLILSATGRLEEPPRCHLQPGIPGSFLKKTTSRAIQPFAISVTRSVYTGDRTAKRMIKYSN